MCIDEKFLQSLGFNRIQSEKEDRFPRFYKTVDALALILIFDWFTGEFFYVSLPDETDVVSFLVGDLDVVVKDSFTVGTRLRQSITVEARDICQLINVDRIVTFSQLKDALKAFDREIDIYLSFLQEDRLRLGTRVRYNFEDVEDIGVIEDAKIEPGGLLSYVVALSSGRRIKTTRDKLAPILLPSRKRFVITNAETFVNEKEEK